MIVVSSISLSTMISNNLLIPYGFIGALQNESQEKNNKRIVNSRKIGILSLIVLAYAIYRIFILDYSLVSIGFRTEDQQMRRDLMKSRLVLEKMEFDSYRLFISENAAPEIESSETCDIGDRKFIVKVTGVDVTWRRWNVE